MTFHFEPIGSIHTPFTQTAGMPIQPVGAGGVRGWLDIDWRYYDALSDLDGFSHVILIYAFHQAGAYQPRVKPFMDTVQRGVLATRAPRRPNPIGLSVVRLLRIDGTTLHVEGVDMLDGTPLLDLKPYIPAFDSHPDATTGWMTDPALARDQRADSRFNC